MLSNHSIHRPNQYPSPSPTWLNYRKFFQRWTALPSIAASGKHLGHYKRLCMISLRLEQDPPIKPLADAIIDLQLQLSNVALTYGYVYDRWKKIVSVIIEKKPGLFLLEKLRTMQLFEAHYNWLLGLVFGRCLVYSTEEQKQSSDSNGMHAPRTLNRTTRPPYKTMSHEISWLTRTPLGILDKDAQKC